MKEQKPQGLSEYADIRYLQPDKVIFKKTLGGFIALEIGEEEKYERVNLFRAFPFSRDNEYISVREPDGKEIGILRSLEDFNTDVVKLLMEELERRYFLPTIKEIHSIKEEFGYAYWDVLTDAGPRRFTIKKEHNSITNIDGLRVLIFDVDGNRFEIPDYTKLDGKSLKMVELLI